MTDTQNGQNEGQGPAPVAMPTTNQPVEVSAPPVEEARPAEPTGELPAEVSERTRKEFEKLKETNRVLAEQLKAKEAPPAPRRSAFDMFAPPGTSSPVPQGPPAMPPLGPQVPPSPPPEAIAPIVPDENGYVDVNVLNQTIARVNEATRQVKETAKTAEEKAREAVDKVSKYEHTDKTLKTYAAHPYLDPNGTQFDEKFSELVTKELLFQMYSGGKQDYLAAADAVKARYYDPMKKAPSEAELKHKETVAQRDQITPPSGGRAPETTDDAVLIEGTRRGNVNLINERLKKSGY